MENHKKSNFIFHPEETDLTKTEGTTVCFNGLQAKTRIKVSIVVTPVYAVAAVPGRELVQLRVPERLDGVGGRQLRLQQPAVDAAAARPSPCSALVILGSS